MARIQADTDADFLKSLNGYQGSGIGLSWGVAVRVMMEACFGIKDKNLGKRKARE
jgi:hypothetical protein